MVELRNSDEFDLRIAPVAKQLGDARAAYIGAAVTEIATLRAELPTASRTSR